MSNIKNKLGTIYEVTCLNTGKIYIGFTTNFDIRKYNHKQSYFKKDNKFYRAIRKHGWDNFNWKIIYQSLDVNHCLKTMESYFIQEYNSYKNGYNETLGGEGTIGFKHTKEFKEKKSIFFSKNNPSFGGISEKQKQKISNTKSLNWIITTPDMEKIKITNLYNFCKKNNLHVSAMVRVASGERKHHKNFVCEKVI